ncbi:MAG: hypothetical protein IJ043_04190 [Clostridia bacterium]|nr:hypothetical protein [Clostridia bacterium]
MRNIIAAGSTDPYEYSCDNGVILLETTEENYNSNWHTTEIQLDFEVMSGYSAEQKRKTLIHEIGHALKLTHTYSWYKKDGDSYYWDDVPLLYTVMDQGAYTQKVPTVLDGYRLCEKWETNY